MECLGYRGDFYGLSSMRNTYMNFMTSRTVIWNILRIYSNDIRYRLERSISVKYSVINRKFTSRITWIMKRRLRYVISAICFDHIYKILNKFVQWIWVHLSLHGQKHILQQVIPVRVFKRPIWTKPHVSSSSKAILDLSYTSYLRWVWIRNLGL